MSGAALRKAAQLGIIGIVCGGVIDRELMDYLAEALNQPGYDIGVAITGQEPIAFTLIVTEGFGTIDMAKRTFALFQSLQGKTASINGATQIRAGVIRPEVVVPLSDAPTAIAKDDSDAESGQLGIGTPIRVIREPYSASSAPSPVSRKSSRKSNPKPWSASSKPNSKTAAPSPSPAPT